jgi:hypothetical protein
MGTRPPRERLAARNELLARGAAKARAHNDGGVLIIAGGGQRATRLNLLVTGGDAKVSRSLDARSN